MRRGAAGLGLLALLGAAALAVFAVPVVAARLAGGAYLSVPSGSMKPALLPGDTLLARAADDPHAIDRGDVIVHDHQGQHYLARVVALGGDRIALRDGTVVLNGAPLGRKQIEDFVEPFRSSGAASAIPRCRDMPRMGEPCHKSQFVETLPSGRSYRVLDIRDSLADTYPETEVPPGHVFVMGDNRDNAIDSRYDDPGPGMVPVAAIRYRDLRIHYSTDPDGRLRPGRSFARVR